MSRSNANAMSNPERQMKLAAKVMNQDREILRALRWPARKHSGDFC
jgi:hypothetical protein